MTTNTYDNDQYYSSEVNPSSDQVDNTFPNESNYIPSNYVQDNDVYAQFQAEQQYHGDY